jgi:hypothetical protein
MPRKMCRCSRGTQSLFPETAIPIMKLRTGIYLSLMLMLIIAPVRAQVSNNDTPPTNEASAPDTAPGTAPTVDADRMIIPPAVSGVNYPVLPTSQERSNYLRGGVAFMTAYTDNALGGLSGKPLSDVSYSVAPFVSMDQTTAREHLVVNYAPGYTVYQRFSGFNMADQNASVRFAYRLSPHVTFSASDVFQKTSNVFNQPYLDTAGAVNTGPALPNFSVVPPIANELNNVGSVGLAYQFALNDMTGANGTFTNLHYPNPSQVPGLFDSGGQSGLAFEAHRLSERQYVGIAYQYQRLIAYPSGGVSETQTHAPLLFYTVYPEKQVTLSFFGGPQYYDTAPPSPQLPLKQWSPAGGASLSWQARLTSFALSYTHIISSSAGLIGAVKLDNASATLSQQLTRSLSASVSGTYAQNDLLGQFTTSQGVLNGHSIIGMASLQQQFGQNIAVRLGYTRLRQDYGSVPLLALMPSTNREFISFTYNFNKALGR